MNIAENFKNYRLNAPRFLKGEDEKWVRVKLNRGRIYEKNLHFRQHRFHRNSKP